MMPEPASVAVKVALTDVLVRVAPADGEVIVTTGGVESLAIWKWTVAMPEFAGVALSVAVTTTVCAPFDKPV